jgi:hypothetical protein
MQETFHLLPHAHPSHPFFPFILDEKDKCGVKTNQLATLDTHNKTNKTKTNNKQQQQLTNKVNVVKQTG